MVPTASQAHRHEQPRAHSHGPAASHGPAHETAHEIAHAPPHAHGTSAPHPAQAEHWSILRMTVAARLIAAAAVCVVLWATVWLAMR